jgi:molybdopterin/thiamine biosynthesis adenylyltransferase
MVLVLALMAALWGVGHLLRVPKAVQIVMLTCVWLGVVAVHFLLPDTHSLRLALGGSARGWLVLGGLVLLLFGYRWGLGQLRGRVAPAAEPIRTATFRPAELERYARHIILREIGGSGQKKLKDAKVLVVGAGGLGSPALLYLAASGVGVIGVVDDDVVDNSNLQRQVIHTDNQIGATKVQSALAAMKALNPFITLRAHACRLDQTTAGLIDEYDLILDGSDNFDTRYLVNRLAAASGKPLISSAITQWEGQISLYDPAQGGPCYECVFPVRPAPGMVPSCAEAGVAAPLPGVIGSLMAMEAVKHLTGAGETLKGRLMIYDGLYGEVRVIGVKPRIDCAICGVSH